MDQSNYKDGPKHLQSWTTVITKVTPIGAISAAMLGRTILAVALARN